MLHNSIPPRAPGGPPQCTPIILPSPGLLQPHWLPSGSGTDQPIPLSGLRLLSRYLHGSAPHLSGLYSCHLLNKQLHLRQLPSPSPCTPSITTNTLQVLLIYFSSTSPSPPTAVRQGLCFAHCYLPTNIPGTHGKSNTYLLDERMSRWILSFTGSSPGQLHQAVIRQTEETENFGRSELYRADNTSSKSWWIWFEESFTFVF